MMLDKLKKRLRNEDYDLSFEEFVRKLNIEEDFKKYEDAYVDDAISSFDRKIMFPDVLYAEEEFRDKKLVEEAKSNLRNYIISVVNSSTLWGYDRAYNLIPDISLPIAKMIASCTIGIDVYPEVRNECETGRVVSMVNGGFGLCEYSSYLKNLNSKMADWFKHYLERNTLRCLSGTIVGNSGEWDSFINNVSRTLTHIAIYKTAKKSDYFVMSMHSIFEIASLRFILQELKEELGIRIFYDGSDSFPLEMYRSIFRGVFDDILGGIEFGSTYSECYNKSALNDIWKNESEYHIIMSALYDESDFSWLELYNDADAMFDKVSLIADAIYDKDRYLIVNRGTEAEKNIDQITKSNPEYSALYSVEL